MSFLYVYVLDTAADWELGYVISELNSGRFFKHGVDRIPVKTVSYSRAPVKTMGGLTIVPDCVTGDIVVNKSDVLLLPGAETWNDQKHKAVIATASEFLACGAVVGAICGATAALADYGLLDTRLHTSNGPGFLEMVCPRYAGQRSYIDMPSVADDNLITAGSTGALLWAKQIIEHLDVFRSDTLRSWYDYFTTGKPDHFFALMNSIAPGKAGALL
jgi:putative intracellular protease/amidase